MSERDRALLQRRQMAAQINTLLAEALRVPKLESENRALRAANREARAHIVTVSMAMRQAGVTQ